MIDNEKDSIVFQEKTISELTQYATENLGFQYGIEQDGVQLAIWTKTLNVYIQFYKKTSYEKKIVELKIQLVPTNFESFYTIENYSIEHKSINKLMEFLSTIDTSKYNHSYSID